MCVCVPIQLMPFIWVCAFTLDDFTLVFVQGTQGSQQDGSATLKSVWVAPSQLRWTNGAHPMHRAMSCVLYSFKVIGALARAGYTLPLLLTSWKSEPGILTLLTQQILTRKVVNLPFSFALYHIHEWPNSAQEKPFTDTVWTGTNGASTDAHLQAFLVSQQSAQGSKVWGTRTRMPNKAQCTNGNERTKHLWNTLQKLRT